MKTLGCKTANIYVKAYQFNTQYKDDVTISVH